VIDKLLRGLEEAAAKRKAEMIGHYVKMTLGIDHPSLRQIPKDRLTDLDEEVYHAIRGMTLGADVIIGTFSDESVIIRLDRYGKSHWETNYSVIGEGADIALAFLCQQPWDFGGSSDPPCVGWVNPLTLMQCLYRVYEAKKAAEKNRSVGESTAFSVLIKDTGRFDISDEGRDILYDRFEKKRRVPQIEFKPSYLESEEKEKRP
jgi:20S proteasome alpha/beta subunit